jgi:hypothetical protein
MFGQQLLADVIIYLLLSSVFFMYYRDLVIDGRHVFFEEGQTLLKKFVTLFQIVHLLVQTSDIVVYDARKNGLDHKLALISLNLQYFLRLFQNVHAFL